MFIERRYWNADTHAGGKIENEKGKAVVW